MMALTHALWKIPRAVWWYLIMLMPELPLTVIEWDEWGDPLHDKDVYEYMASYAPYENIEAKNYPNTNTVVIDLHDVMQRVRMAFPSGAHIFCCW